MKSGLKHIDVGAELTKTEWESEESHELIHGNSFPSSPVERQLFYRDDLHEWYIYDGSAWVSLQGAGGGGMEVHGNEYHDPDFEQQGVAASLVATHQATDVHTQPQVPAAHKTAHQDGGADEISLAGLDGEPSTLATHKNLTTGVHGVGAGTIAKIGDIAVDANLSAAAQDAIAKKHTQGTDTALGAVGTKDPPIDADKAIYRDSADSDNLKTSTWSQIKAFFKTYFDTIYSVLGHTHSDLSPAHKDATTGVHGVGASTVESASGSQDKINTHAALTTGVHGVGSGYIAKSSVDGLDLADHDSRHGYLGADELPILYLNAQRAIPVIHKHFGDLGGLTEAHSGGSLTLGIVYGVLNSGASTSNYGKIYMSQTCYHAYTAYGHTLGIKISVRQSTAQDMWLGWFESTTPGTNQNHYAFRVINNELFAYAGKSDAAKQNSGALAWDGQDVFLSMRDSSDAIKFYVDHALVYSVTNSANRPFGVSLYLVFYLKTTEAVNKQCFLCPFTLFTAHNH